MDETNRDEFKKKEENEDFLDDNEELETEEEPFKEVSPVSESPKESKDDKWDFSEENEEGSKPGSTWKIIAGVLLVLLIVAVYTNGFNFTGAATTATGSDISQSVAEKKVLDYVNNNLLQAPFVATLKSAKAVGNLYEVKIDVGGQEVDSYITKDGKLFFPQGFDLTKAVTKPTSTTTTTKKVDVSADDDAVKGSKDATVTIIEFSEYECPFCKKYIDETYPSILKDYINTGKVKYVFRDFPLSFHANAKPAAMAAECAGDQGKYWEYHDLLFKNQATLGKDNFKKWAKDLGLDTTVFNTCVDNETHKLEVEKDMADGQKAGVSGTPAFIINGKLISGAQPYSVFKQAIEEELKTTAGTTAGTTTTTPPKTTTTGTTKEVKITAKKWRFDPNIATVNQGDTVKLTVSSPFDLNFVLSDFNVASEITAGTPKTIEFVASKKGTFTFNCGTYCYKTYGDVQGGALNGKLVVN